MFLSLRLHFREKFLYLLLLKLKTASLSFNEMGTPTSSEFDDVYFSNHNGLAESKYVFLDHNLLNKRFFSHPTKHLTIAETGFGTGLNFLLTAKFFLDFLKEKSAGSSLERLYFITAEKFPIEKQQLQKALEQWPELQDLSEQLLVQYPVLTPGCHRLSFAGGRIVLDLWLGDVNDIFSELHIYQDGLVDAWYLDGFAPGKNPDMWQPKLFTEMARLSRPEATFATFTAAGIVKRGLKENGFIVEKVKGFGKKRDMLRGFYAPEEALKLYAETNSEPPLDLSKISVQKRHLGPWQRQAGSGDKDKVAVIGAGLAGANAALALAKKGHSVSLFCADVQPAMGASGNHLGGFYPSLNADFSLQSQFYCHAFGYARRLYQEVNNSTVNNDFAFGHDWCGVFFPAFSDEVLSRQQKLLENNIWPSELVHWLKESQAEQACGIHMPYSGLFIPGAGWINPSELVNALIENASGLGATLFTNKRLTALEYDGQRWQLNWEDNSRSEFDKVILATGVGSVTQPFLEDIPFTQSRGQVEYLPDSDPDFSPKAVICHKGYFTPFYQGKQAVGATFDKKNLHSMETVEDTLKNQQTIQKALSRCDWLTRLPQPVENRAAIRCSLPDHRPIMGAVPNLAEQKREYSELYKAKPLTSYPLPNEYEGLYVITGLGSHGLCTSPLLAEALACQISGEPLPLGSELLASLSPNRFLVRDLIKRKI
jgi:tRNA 5-methylaminomethyl-2-thiouridine biosynthesis bifunctional protein